MSDAWKDTSSFSQRDTERTPKEFTLSLPGARVVVHHHIDYPRDVWLYSFHGLDRSRVESGTDLEQAKRDAITNTITALQTLLSALKAVPQ